MWIMTLSVWTGFYGSNGRQPGNFSHFCPKQILASQETHCTNLFDSEQTDNELYQAVSLLPGSSISSFILATVNNCLFFLYFILF